MKTLPAGQFFCALGLAAFAAVLVVAALGLPNEVQIVPLIVGVPTLVLLAVLLVGEFVPPLIRWTETTLDDLLSGERLKGIEVGDAAQDVPWRSVLRIWTWIVGALVMVFVLGFFVVAPVFVAAFLVLEARVRIVRAAASSVVSCVLVFTGLEFLAVDLWPGVIPEIVEGFLGGGILPPI